MALASGRTPRVDRGYPPPGVTAIGFATAKVDATEPRLRGARIRRAVEAANAKARPRAFADAQRKAAAIGATAGMRLGAVWAVGQDPNVPYYGSASPRARSAATTTAPAPLARASGRCRAAGCVRIFKQRFRARRRRT